MTRQMRYLRRLFAAGKCIKCRKPNRKGTWRCPYCTKEHNDKYVKKSKRKAAKMKRALIVLCIILVLMVVLFPNPVKADTYATGYQEDGYSYMGAGYWSNPAGDYYTRTRYDYTGYKTCYSCGYAYQQAQPYYYYKYYPAHTPKATIAALNPLKDNVDLAVVDYAKNRDTIHGRILTQKAADEGFIAKMKLVGITPAFPAIPGYDNGPAFENHGYNKSLQAGNYGFQGNTVYGYSFNQTADYYSPLDRAVLYQQSFANLNGIRALLGDANAGTLALVNNESAAAERLQAQKLNNDKELQSQRIQGELAIEAIKAARPPNKIITNIQGVGTTPIDPGPYPMPRVNPEREPRAVEGPDKKLMNQAFVKANCIGCHEGAKASGKLDLTKPITSDQYLASINRISLPAKNKDHMPKGKDGGEGPQLNLAEIRSVLE